MNHLLCISLNSRGVKDEWAWKPWTQLYASHKHSLQIFMCPQAPLPGIQESRTLSLFLKDVCCAKSVGSLRSEFCHDPRKQGGQEHREHQQHTYRAEIQGDATLYLCYTIKGAGWVVQPGPSTDLPWGQKVSTLCRRLGTNTDGDMSGNTCLWLSASPRLITRTHGAIFLFCRVWSGAQSTQIGLHLNTPRLF